MSTEQTPTLTMTVLLAQRSYGVHDDITGCLVPGTFSDYAKPTGRHEDYIIDEARLLAALPDGFLPDPPGRVLLMVRDENGGTGQDGRTHFRTWGKYFNAYVINLVKPDGDA